MWIDKTIFGLITKFKTVYKNPWIIEWNAHTESNVSGHLFYLLTLVHYFYSFSLLYISYSFLSKIIHIILLFPYQSKSKIIHLTFSSFNSIFCRRTREDSLPASMLLADPRLLFLYRWFLWTQARIIKNATMIKAQPPTAINALATGENISSSSSADEWC